MFHIVDFQNKQVQIDNSLIDKVSSSFRTTIWELLVDAQYRWYY
jgi:hypothetical protein